MSITIEEFDRLGMELLSLRGKIDDLKNQLKPIQEEYDGLEEKISKIMLEQDKTSYRFKGGMLILNRRVSVTTPKTPEQKKEFFDWLRAEKGDDVYWHYMSVNSQALNAFIKAETEAALERKDIDFKVPGVGPENVQYIVSLRRT